VTEGARAVFLLPAWSELGRQSLTPEIARALGQGDALADGDAGRVAQSQRQFVSVPNHWAPAAWCRQLDRGDASGAAWLRVDPAHVRPDMNGVRLLGVGERLGLAQDDVDALLPALRPLFGDSGFELDAPTPSRWYLRLRPETRLPSFSEPDTALGEDLFEHQPDGADARRWRALLNEVQVVLHNHDWNQRRRERGLVPINALWLWGGGVLPTSVACDFDLVNSDDEVLRAIAHCAGVESRSLATSFVAATGRTLHDLRRYRDLATLQRDWLRPALAAVRSGQLKTLELDAADGLRRSLASAHRWRFWRRPWSPPRTADAAP